METVEKITSTLKSEVRENKKLLKQAQRETKQLQNDNKNLKKSIDNYVSAISKKEKEMSHLAAKNVDTANEVQVLQSFLKDFSKYITYDTISFFMYILL